MKDVYGRPTEIEGIPQFLRDAALRTPPISAQELDRLANPRSREWAPVRKEGEWAKRPEVPTYVDDRSLPVVVNVRTKAVPELLARYGNMDEFEAAHDKKTYPISRTARYDGETIVLVTAKPWAGREKAPPKEKKQGRSKVDVIADLLIRAEGCTTADVLEATGWPSVSMPAQAKLAGLALRKEKLKGQPARYWGTKVDLVKKLTGAF